MWADTINPKFIPDFGCWNGWRIEHIVFGKKKIKIIVKRARHLKAVFFKESRFFKWVSQWKIWRIKLKELQQKQAVTSITIADTRAELSEVGEKTSLVLRKISVTLTAPRDTTKVLSRESFLIFECVTLKSLKSYANNSGYGLKVDLLWLKKLLWKEPSKIDTIEKPI